MARCVLLGPYILTSYVGFECLPEQRQNLTRVSVTWLGNEVWLCLLLWFWWTVRADDGSDENRAYCARDDGGAPESEYDGSIVETVWEFRASWFDIDLNSEPRPGRCSSDQLAWVSILCAYVALL